MRPHVALVIAVAIALCACDAAIADLGSGPPPAFLQTATRKVRLAQSSYCWHSPGGGGLCADYAPANCGGIAPAPRVTVRKRERVRLLLGFTPNILTVQLGIPLGRTMSLPLRRMTSFRVTRGGVLLVSAADASGDTSYAACIVLR
jgi:hypothetical protein